MKSLLAILLLVTSTFLCRAEVPPEVRAQFHADIRTLFIQQGAEQFTDEQIDMLVSKMTDNAIKELPTLFSPSSNELKSFIENNIIYTDAQIEKSYTDVKTLSGNRPMPQTLEFYKKLHDSGTLTPKQRFIFHRFSLAVIEKFDK